MTILSALRSAFQADGFAGFLIPRADRHQNENPPASDERLAFATGFTGSAGVAVILDRAAALFVDGRYESQAPQQINDAGIEVVAIRNMTISQWLKDNAAEGARIAFDPWLHPKAEIAELEKALQAAGVVFQPAPANYLDPLWSDRPAPPDGPARLHPAAYAGEDAASKRERIGEILTAEKLDAVVLTDPQSLCWLLNIRGGDTPYTPLLLCFGTLKQSGAATLYCRPNAISDDIRAALGPDVAVADWESFDDALAELRGLRVAVDRKRAPIAVSQALEAAGAEVVWRDDPCLTPKARKNAAEIAGARAAHKRDGAAMCRFFAWLEGALAAGDALDEAGVGRAVVWFRNEVGAALDAPHKEESFPNIVAFGPNGALPHYRAPEQGSARIVGDGLLLIDSGGQYRDGTTDITRMVAIGAPSFEMRAACSRVLKGMIAVTELLFPAKTEGRALDSFARIALWRAGLDYDHGTGHGVGSYLSVHEGPQSLSKRGAIALEEGMILSNEPGCYKPGAFGVRIENLVLVAAPAVPTDALAPGEPLGDRPMHRFETLTLAPIDRRILAIELLTAEERAWLDAYHARVRAELTPLLADGPSADPAAAAWLHAATEPLSATS